MTSTLALLPSPFLGPAVWRPVADVLSARGHAVVVPPAGTDAPSAPEDVVRSFLDALAEHEDLVLVPHSNAGLYVPAITAQRRVWASVFVDALLPPRRGDAPVTSPALLEMMRARTDSDGLLPPWTAWWEDADVTGLFPSAAVRRSVEREQRRLPLSYLEASVTIPPGWDGLPGAYLAFGDTYADDQADAASRGWRVATVPGRHLHMLIAPDQIAEQILTLLAAADPSL